MDTLQLNRINELAREYLRLGIAKSTSDAVEKARFQLAFEKDRAPPEASPYESLFAARQREAGQDPGAEDERPEPRGEALSPLDIKRDRFDEFRQRLSSIESEHEQKLRAQSTRIAQLESTLAQLRAEVGELKRAPRPAPPSNELQHAGTDGPISSTIEQTIKGRKISSADVAVDKIFYFGNR